MRHNYRRVSSTQIVHSEICLACLAMRWAALFPSLRVQDVFQALNFGTQDFILVTSCWIWIGPGSWLAMAFITIWESPSRIISLRPNSQEKIMPVSATLALAARASNGYQSVLLRAPMIWPLSFRSTTPIPHWPRSAKTSPLTFVLYQPGGGGLYHGFKNRYGERTGKCSNYRFYGRTSMVEPVTS